MEYFKEYKVLDLRQQFLGFPRLFFDRPAPSICLSHCSSVAQDLKFGRRPVLWDLSHQTAIFVRFNECTKQSQSGKPLM